ncbi:hypothetical protein EYF80_019617 [Liparis tanakae]|uniref:Uncharacterized protein n=1 Tax=Liparis tanakae TaxID=230148 RepID=A0A4Z2HWP3_9TELE|nr:hypothetical protein EYF80_019617 [Liparis tanakae]
MEENRKEGGTVQIAACVLLPVCQARSASSISLRAPEALSLAALPTGRRKHPPGGAGTRSERDRGY